MARDHPSFSFEAPFYMSTTYLIVYVKSCEMSYESWKTKRNVMQNARDVMWKLKTQAKCDAKCKECHVKVEKPSKMWCKIQEMSCESWKTKQNVRSQNARNVMWKLRKPSKMWWKMQGDLSRYECWSKQWPLQNHFLNQQLISSANTNLRPTICNALTDFPLVSLALISAERISTSLTLTNAYKLCIQNSKFVS
jgi:ferredoxin